MVTLLQIKTRKHAQNRQKRFSTLHFTRVMRTPTFGICENKDAAPLFSLL